MNKCLDIALPRTFFLASFSFVWRQRLQCGVLLYWPQACNITQYTTFGHHPGLSGYFLKFFSGGCSVMDSQRLFCPPCVAAVASAASPALSSARPLCLRWRLRRRCRHLAEDGEPGQTHDARPPHYEVVHHGRGAAAAAAARWGGGGGGVDTRITHPRPGCDSRIRAQCQLEL